MTEWDDPESSHSPQETIVVGYTTRDPGPQALSEAIEEAHRRAARVVVVHAMKGGPCRDQELLELQTHRQALKDLESTLRDEGIPHKVGLHVRGMSPAEDLAATVREEDGSLLVIGYRRRSRAGKFVLGSDTREILMNSPCPVLAVGQSGSEDNARG